MLGDFNPQGVFSDKRNPTDLRWRAYSQERMGYVVADHLLTFDTVFKTPKWSSVYRNPLEEYLDTIYLSNHRVWDESVNRNYMSMVRMISIFKMYSRNNKSFGKDDESPVYLTSQEIDIICDEIMSQNLDGCYLGGDMRDFVKGLLYGQAIGDALGTGTEYMSSGEVRSAFPGGIYYYDQRVPRKNSPCTWELGEWSDDTDQAIIILEALCRNSSDVDKVCDDIFQGFVAWLNEKGKGSGSLTRAVLRSGSRSASESVWRDKGSNSAPNGAVMRTSYVGVLPYPKVVEYADKIAATTHYDPRCRASSILVACAVSRLVHGPRDNLTYESILSDLSQISPSYPGTILTSTDIQQAVSWIGDHPTLGSLKLDEGLPRIKGKPVLIGYTYQTLAVGFYALERVMGGSSFVDVLSEIISYGGDTDTNAALAGSMMGAYLGCDKLPQYLCEGLYNRFRLDDLLSTFMATLK